MIGCAVILAVGSSSHQSRIAFSRPRAMLPILGKPLILRMIELFYRVGIRHYVIVVGEDEGEVASYLHSRLPGTQVEFVFQSSNNSLARTLAMVAKQLVQPFIIASYNAFVHPNFPDRLLKHYCDFKGNLVLTGTPLTLSTASSHYFGVTNGQQVTQIVKGNPEPESHAILLSNLAICGDGFVQYLSSLALNTGIFTNQFLDMVQLYLQTGETASVAESAWTLPIETDYDLLTLNRFFLNNLHDCHILSEIPNNVQIIPPVRIDPMVSIGQGAQIGPRVYLESGCSIGQYAAVSDAIVLQNAVVPARQHVTDAIVSVHPINPADGEHRPS